MSDEELLDGWIPYRLIQEADGKIKFRWLFVGGYRFAEPFFEESIAACLSLPQNIPGSFPLTSPETVSRVASLTDSIPVSGIIYHISRCGSTLLSQLLCCDDRNVVLSEVPLLDSILQQPVGAMDDSTKEQLFKAVLRLLSRRKKGNEEKVFLKTDSWHILYHDKLRKWFPSVPIFLMHRSPKEVGESHAKLPGMHSVPGVLNPRLFGLTEEESMYMTRESYLDQVLCCYFDAYIRVIGTDENSIVLNYHNGVLNMMNDIGDACGIVCDPSLISLMEHRSGFHSKHPEKTYDGDESGPKTGDFPLAENKFGEFISIAGLKFPIYDA